MTREKPSHLEQRLPDNEYLVSHIVIVYILIMKEKKEKKCKKPKKEKKEKVLHETEP